MLLEKIKKYYSNLLIEQYKNKTKAKATIEALFEALIQNLVFLDFKNAFLLEEAKGVQLDILASFVGLERKIVFQNQARILTDEELRFFIPFLAMRNHNISSYEKIKELIYNFGKNNIAVFDNLTMKLTIYIKQSELEKMQLLIALDGFPKPCGVGISPIFVLESFENIFSFSSYVGHQPTGTSGYSFYNNLPNNSQMLSYTNATF